MLNGQLEWSPQDSYCDYFVHDANDIVYNRSVFRTDIENFIAYGGRGSGKTWTFADAIIIEATLRPIRVLVTREYQGSINDSIKAELENAIVSRGLEDEFTIYRQEITSRNGSKFIFKGLQNNINSLKSIAAVDIVICEEAENISKRSWDKLLPSIRPNDKVFRGGVPIVVVIFNPNSQYSDTYHRWVLSPPPASISKKINWYENYYFPEHLNRQRLHFQKTRSQKEYAHEWEGEPVGAESNTIIDLNWIKAARFASKLPGFQKIGPKVVGYDPSGQGKDANAAVFLDGNVVMEIDEWVTSVDLREATNRAFSLALRYSAESFVFDNCGGLGDGVSVFVSDRQKLLPLFSNITITPFDGGAGVVDPDELIPDTDKTWHDMYSNSKAQVAGIVSQILYNTYRFVVFGDRDSEPSALMSIDIEDDDLFDKLAQELSTPIWVLSKVNSKKRVEDKSDIERRTGMKSPNIADALMMTRLPIESDKLVELLRMAVH